MSALGVLDEERVAGLAAGPAAVPAGGAAVRTLADPGADVWTGWAELLGQQRDSLVRIAHLRLRRDVSGSDAEDVVHEVFLRVVGRGPDPRDVDRPAAYLRRAVVNECVTRWRRHRELAVDDTPDRQEGDHADRCVTAVAVRAALDLLTPRQRSVIVLGFLHGYGDDEVAAAMGIEPVTVRTMRARALRRMRAAFDDPRESGKTVREPAAAPRSEPTPHVARRVILPAGPAPESRLGAGVRPGVPSPGGRTAPTSRATTRATTGSTAVAGTGASTVVRPRTPA